MFFYGTRLFERFRVVCRSRKFSSAPDRAYLCKQYHLTSFFVWQINSSRCSASYCYLCEFVSFKRRVEDSINWMIFFCIIMYPVYCEIYASIRVEWTWCIKGYDHQVNNTTVSFRAFFPPLRVLSRRPIGWWNYELKPAVRVCFWFE